MTANFDQRTITALEKIATPDEIADLIAILDHLSRGRAENWMTSYIAAIIIGLVERAKCAGKVVK